MREEASQWCLHGGCAGAVPMCCHFWLLTEVQPFNAVLTWPAQQQLCQISSPVGQLTRLMCLFQENEVNLTHCTSQTPGRAPGCVISFVVQHARSTHHLMTSAGQLDVLGLPD